MTNKSPLFALIKSENKFKVLSFATSLAENYEKYYKKLQVIVDGEVKPLEDELDLIIKNARELLIGDEICDWVKIKITAGAKPTFLNKIIELSQDIVENSKIKSIDGIGVPYNKKYIFIEDRKPSDFQDSIHFVNSWFKKGKAKFKDFDEPILMFSKIVDLIYDVEQDFLYFRKIQIAKKFFLESMREFDAEIDVNGLRELLPPKFFSYKEYGGELEGALNNFARTYKIKLSNVLGRNYIEKYLKDDYSRKKLFDYLSNQIRENESFQDFELIDNGKFIIPKNKLAIKIFVKALDEDYFVGALSEEKFVSNSKQRQS